MANDWATALAGIAGALAGIAVTPWFVFRHRRTVERETLAANLIDLLRHTEQNWRVMDEIAKGEDKIAMPLPMHFEKLRSVGQIISDDALRFLPEGQRTRALHLRHRLENLETEIDQGLALIAAGDRDGLQMVVSHLINTLLRLDDFLRRNWRGFGLRMGDLPLKTLPEAPPKEERKTIYYRPVAQVAGPDRTARPGGEAAVR